MNIEVNNKKFELFIDHERIMKRTRLLGIQIGLDFEHETPILLGVLNGSFMFMADLLKEIPIPLEVSFVKLASYSGVQRQEEIEELIGLDTNQSFAGKHILIVEDIIDSGYTLQKMIAFLKTYDPLSISVCALLLKPSALKVDLGELQYIGFEIENQFVVGYGMDFDGLGRNLPNIYREIR